MNRIEKQRRMLEVLPTRHLKRVLTLENFARWGEPSTSWQLSTDNLPENAQRALASFEEVVIQVKTIDQIIHM